MQNIDEFSTKARFVTSFYGSNEASLKFQLRNGLLKDVGELKPVEGVENAFYLNLPINQYLERITAKQSVKSKL
jgi:hypothetical protein